MDTWDTQVFERRFRMHPGLRLDVRARGSIEDSSETNGTTQFYAAVTDGKNVRSLVDAQTALLLFSIAKPHQIPDHFLHQHPEEFGRLLRRMVRDGIIEIETEQGGDFIHGASALPSSIDLSALSDNSRDLLLSAAEMAAWDMEAHVITQFLYNFGACPVKNDWRQSDLDTDWTRILENTIKPYEPLRTRGKFQVTEAWIYWRRGNNKEINISFDVYKLYLGLNPQFLLDHIATLLPVTSSHDPLGMKWPHQPLRAERMICYFESREALNATAIELDALWRKGEADAKPVPLTSAVGDGGWLSWGVDPSDGWDESWRQKVCEGLAIGLTRAQGKPEERLAQALSRMQDLGVDVVSWSPIGKH